jgi:hypothetical protein
MEFSINSGNVFFCSILDFREPLNNGTTGVVLYGLNVPKTHQANSILKLDLKVSNGETTYDGHLIDVRVNEDQMVKLETAPYISILQSWINVRDIYGVPLEKTESGFHCSALFAIRTRKSNVLNCNKIDLYVTDSVGAEHKMTMPISDAMKLQYTSSSTRLLIQ